MAFSRKLEARALGADELELVEKSHHPALQALPDGELSGLAKQLRERRDQAKAEAERHRREMRAKGPLPPVGPARDAGPRPADAGPRTRLQILAKAIRRVNTEAARRGRATGPAVPAAAQ